MWPLIKSTLHKNEVSHHEVFSKCDQICSFLRNCSHLLKKSLMENFIFCAVALHQITLLFSKLQQFISVFKKFIKFAAVPAKSRKLHLQCVLKQKLLCSTQDATKQPQQEKSKAEEKLNMVVPYDISDKIITELLRDVQNFKRVTLGFSVKPGLR